MLKVSFIMVNFGLSIFNFTGVFREMLCLMNDEAVLVIFDIKNHHLTIHYPQLPAPAAAVLPAGDGRGAEQPQVPDLCAGGGAGGGEL